MEIIKYFENKYKSFINQTLLPEIKKKILPINQNTIQLKNILTIIYKYKNDIYNLDIEYDNYCKLSSSVRHICTQVVEFSDGTKIKDILNNNNKIIIPINAFKSSIIIQHFFRKYIKKKIIILIRLMLTNKKIPLELQYNIIKLYIK